jgi:hypothetical protein
LKSCAAELIPLRSPKPEHGRLISDGQVPTHPQVQQETMFVASVATPREAVID